MLISVGDLPFPFLVLLIAYVIFGLTGFGTALIAAPLLAFYMPVAMVIPLLASALFGSGGFLYAIYLAGRLENKVSFRATQSLLIKCSTLTRVLLFFLAGIYSRAFLLTALACLPALIAGLYLGRHISFNLSKEQVSSHCPYSHPHLRSRSSHSLFFNRLT